MSTHAAEATKAAKSLRLNALVCGALALAVLASAPLTAGAHGFATTLGWLLLLALTLTVLALSVHLLFDAALFRLAASHDEETKGLAAIDDTLARMGLRPAGSEPRSLEHRIAGSRRLVWRQRLALALTLVLFAILLIDATNGPGPC